MDEGKVPFVAKKWLDAAEDKIESLHQELADVKHAHDAVRVREERLKAELAKHEWRDNYTHPITDERVGKVFLIRLRSQFDGISHSDENLGRDCTIDLTWIRCNGEVCATTGKYKNEDILSWKEIFISLPINPPQPEKGGSDD